ncbi:MAG TPA: LLM class flavin-dependent oxidoreductase [Pseudonocardiaceae bacterium]|jgi:alkanesulfonate monooxygenase SsuD/methylene tetrahydromethanopterin reductase-like flavin-dependent oxidoreductase (luciferase family)|nr:LLM class flavin-dependent oxidoreductase [Pseudonocardiaceae bacterium]
MRIGLGLPSAVAGTGGRELVDWAIEGERAGFSTLATLDRMVYDNYECLTTLAAAAAVTERIRLTTAIMIAPLRSNTALLAKQAATVDRLSDGRLTLGMAVGVRPDDFRASGVEMAGRGRALDQQLAELRRIWAGDRRGFAGGIGPRPTRPPGPEVILGGHSPGAIARVAAYGDGWISGSGGPGLFSGGAAAVRAAWQRAGRPDAPRLLGLAYFALGDDAAKLAGGYLRDYYGFAPPYAQLVLENAAIGVDGVAETVDRFDDSGCDELILVPCTNDIDQIKLLSEVVG